MNCYIFEEFVFNNALFTGCVDATYILYLEGNGRYDDIINQLKIYHPTQIVYIVHNKGFKKCKKENVNNTVHDILFSNIKVFEHASSKNYNNILILEDDFIFNPIILDEKHINNVCNFVNGLSPKKEFAYLLGCFPFFRIPLYYNTSKVFRYILQHSCIYNSNLYKRIIKDYYDNKIVKPLDEYLPLNSLNIPIYMYNICLCYQLFPNTENSKNWSLDINGNINYFNEKMINFSKLYMNYFQLNKKAEPGYKILYGMSILLFYLLIIIIIIILYFLYFLYNYFIYK
jgi:hypothetical protein